MYSAPLPKNSPIVVSTVVSAALHVAVAAALLYAIDGMVSRESRVDIDVVRVEMPGELREQEKAAQLPPQAQKRADTGSRQSKQPSNRSGQAHVEAAPMPAAIEAPVPAALRETAVAQRQTVAASPAQTAQHSPDQASRSEPQRTAGPPQDRVALIAQLLHDEISAHKRYPYLARRRGLSGVSTVQFMLTPDGRISDTRVIQSSRYRLLDRAAMTAVNRIDPFVRASDYLDGPEQFEINVVFNLH